MEIALRSLLGLNCNHSDSDKELQSSSLSSQVISEASEIKAYKLQNQGLHPRAKTQSNKRCQHYFERLNIPTHPPYIARIEHLTRGEMEWMLESVPRCLMVSARPDVYIVM